MAKSIIYIEDAISTVFNIVRLTSEILNEFSDGEPVFHKPVYLSTSNDINKTLSPLFYYKLEGKGVSEASITMMANYSNSYHTYYPLSFVLGCSCYNEVISSIQTLTEYFRKFPDVSASSDYEILSTDSMLDPSIVKRFLDSCYGTIYKEIPEDVEHKSDLDLIIPKLDFERFRHESKQIDVDYLEIMSYIQASNSFSLLMKFLSSSSVFYSTTYRLETLKKEILSHSNFNDEDFDEICKHRGINLSNIRKLKSVEIELIEIKGKLLTLKSMEVKPS